MHPHLAIILLVANLCAACGEPALQVQIPFEARFSTESISCDEQGDIMLTDLRFYVSDIQLTDTTGRAHKFDLDRDDIWQQPNLALLDLENGRGECVNGTSEVNNVLRGTITQGEYSALSFTLGVPFESNHGDPLLATAPLDDAAMHWHWRGGYKFLRTGVRDSDDSFWLHLGSTGCEGTLQNITGCKAPNRVSVELRDFVPGRDMVVVDLAELLAGDTLSDKISTDCSSGPAEENCVCSFKALGIDHATGRADGEQRVFSSALSP